MKPFMKAGIGIPFVAELLAHIGQGKAPGPRSYKGIDVKAELRHARDAGRERDKSANDGKKPAEQDGNTAAGLEKTCHAVEVFVAHQHVFSVGFDQRTPAPGTNPIGDQRTEVTADGAGGSDPEKAEPCVPCPEAAGRDEIAGKGHDDFGRQRDAGGFDGH